jgi:hypothetical protein
MKMELMTPEILERLKQNNRTKNADHAPVVKFFTPWANATWLIVDIDVDDNDLMFGLCDLGLGEPELGYVLLSDLEELRGPGGLRVERDLYWKAKQPVSVYAFAARNERRIVDVG